eukprot:9065453-Alexandrium_andersonii.AAC.1
MDSHVYVRTCALTYRGTPNIPTSRHAPTRSLACCAQAPPHAWHSPSRALIAKATARAYL